MATLVPTPMADLSLAAWSQAQGQALPSVLHLYLHAWALDPSNGTGSLDSLHYETRSLSVKCHTTPTIPPPMFCMPPPSKGSHYSSLKVQVYLDKLELLLGPGVEVLVPKVSEVSPSFCQRYASESIPSPPKKRKGGGEEGSGGEGREGEKLLVSELC